MSRPLGECNGWLGIAALPCCQGGSAIGLSATDALAEPQPVITGNRHHRILVPQRLKLGQRPHGAKDRGEHRQAAGATTPNLTQAKF
jgi:hypothetical protein